MASLDTTHGANASFIGECNDLVRTLNFVHLLGLSNLEFLEGLEKESGVGWGVGWKYIHGIRYMYIQTCIYVTLQY